jgi:hypothetical protein
VALEMASAVGVPSLHRIRPVQRIFEEGSQPGRTVAEAEPGAVGA